MSLPVHTVLGQEPDSQLGKLGFLYATNPLQGSASGASILGSGKWGGASFGNAAFGSIRTADLDPRAQQEAYAGSPQAQSSIEGEVWANEQIGGPASHASK